MDRSDPPRPARSRPPGLVKKQSDGVDRGVKGASKQCKTFLFCLIQREMPGPRFAWRVCGFCERCSEAKPFWSVGPESRPPQTTCVDSDVFWGP